MSTSALHRPPSTQPRSFHFRSRCWRANLWNLWDWFHFWNAPDRDDLSFHWQCRPFHRSRRTKWSSWALTSQPLRKDNTPRNPPTWKPVQIRFFVKYYDQWKITCLPMLISPVLLYSPSHFPWTSLACSPRLNVRQQGDETFETAQVKCTSSSHSCVSALRNCQQLVGGWLWLPPTLAFSRAVFPFSPTSHSLLDLTRKWMKGSLTCTRDGSYHLVSLLSEPVCRWEIPPARHRGRAQICPRRLYDLQWIQQMISQELQDYNWIVEGWEYRVEISRYNDNSNIS